MPKLIDFAQALDRSLDRVDLAQRRNSETDKQLIRLLWLKYQDADVPLKHAIQLTLRELHRAMPTHEQEEFAELWWRWLDNFEEEEIATGERAESERRYVWSPDAAARLRGCDD